MNDTKDPEIDWTHLPTGYEAQSLWECLHDGKLLSCESDLARRSVALEFDVFYLAEKSDDLRFLVRLDNVTSTRASINVRLPREFIAPDGATREQTSVCSRSTEYKMPRAIHRLV